jgi:hypothetical protein
VETGCFFGGQVPWDALPSLPGHPLDHAKLMSFEITILPVFSLGNGVLNAVGNVNGELKESLLGTL